MLLLCGICAASTGSRGLVGAGGAAGAAHSQCNAQNTWEPLADVVWGCSEASLPSVRLCTSSSPWEEVPGTPA